MNANPDKCTKDKVNIIVENQKICNCPCEKLLKTGLKLNALARIIPYMDLNEKRLL